MSTTQSKTNEMAQDAQFLDDLMTRNPVTVDPEANLDSALRLFDRFPFRHLPVVENEAVIGILSDRDLQLATGRCRTFSFRQRSSASSISISGFSVTMRDCMCSETG